MNFAVISDNIEPLLNGLRGTVILMFATIGIAVILSVPLAFFRDSKWAPLRIVIEAYSWAFRCTPALLLPLPARAGGGAGARTRPAGRQRAPASRRWRRLPG